MKIKVMAEKVLRNSMRNTVKKPCASMWFLGVEKMPESMKKAR